MSTSEWDFIPWDGTANPAPFRVIGVEPWTEDSLLVCFSAEPYCNDLGTVDDALNPELYRITPLDSAGLDGRLSRPVMVTAVQAIPTRLDCVLLIVDRSFSPYPAQYQLDVMGVVDHPGNAPLVVTVTFKGLRRTVESVTVDAELGRDFANPQHGPAMLDPLPTAGNAAFLGVFPYDDSGDYAIDHGETSFQKRILRRMFFTKGRTACLSKNYGLGILGRVKQLSTAHGRESLAVDARDQIALEPEVIEASAQCLQDAAHPGLVWLKPRARLRSTGKWSGFNMPFKTR